MYSEIMEKYKEILNILKFRELDYYSIYELANKKAKIYKYENEEIYFMYSQKYFILSIEQDSHLFFSSPKTVKFNNKNETLVFSSLQIDDYMNKSNILFLYFIPKKFASFKNLGLPRNSKIIYPKEKLKLIFVLDDIINFFSLHKNENLDDQNNKINNPEAIEFSKYFFDYFPYNEKDKQIKFTYIESDERIFLFNILLYFSSNKDHEHKFFKFCGPSGIGKSTTLIFFRNSTKGVIYFNLKALYDYESLDKSFSDMILYELERLEFNDEKEKKDFETKLKDILLIQKIDNMLLRLFEILKNLKKSNTIIFDQFKPYTHFNKIEYNSIKNIVIDSKLKLIISSTIDDNEIKNEIIKTMKTFKYLPLFPEKKYQDYYLYFSEILTPDDLKNYYLNENNYSNKEISIFEQFNFIPKYLKYFIKFGFNKDTLEIIDLIIKNKTKKKILSGQNLELEVIVRIILNYLNKKFDYTLENINLLYYIPLKYFNIHFQANNFYIDYAFPYVKNLYDSISKEYNIKDYFKNKLYEKEFYKEIKGAYFKKFVINKISQLDNFFNAKITNYMTVENLINLEEIENKDNNISHIFDNIQNINEEQINYNDYLKNKIELINKKLEQFNSELNENSVDYYFNASLKSKLEEYKKLIANNKKRKFIKKNNYNDIFRNGGILIDQKRINQRCIDQIFLYGDKDDKNLICLKTEFCMHKVNLSSNYIENSTKKNIKEEIKNLLANVYLHFGITVKQWHLFFIFHYNKKENSFNSQLIEACVKNDLDYIFYEPNLELFYDKYFKTIKNLSLTQLSNLSCNSFSINPYIIFRKHQNFDYLLKKRTRELDSEKLYDSEEITKNIINKWEKNYKVSFEKFFTKIKNLFKIESIKPIDIILIDNKELPSLNPGYGFIFLDKNLRDLILYANLSDEKDITIYKDNFTKAIKPIEIGAHIYLKDNFEFLIVKMKL